MWLNLNVDFSSFVADNNFTTLTEWEVVWPTNPRELSRTFDQINGYILSSHRLLYNTLTSVLKQCCGTASIIMRIRIRDPKNVHMDPDPRG